MDQSQIDILKQVENGEISLDEASELLSRLEESKFEPDAPMQVISPERTSNFETLSTIKKEKPAWAFVFWVLPLFFGIILTIYSSSWLYQNYQEVGLRFKFWITWIPFLSGIFFIYLGWMLQRARWIHVNIRQPEGERPKRIFLAFPIPFQLIGLFLNLFKGKLGNNAPGVDLEELMVTIDQHIKTDEPLYVNVDDKDGTKVEVYIG